MSRRQFLEVTCDECGMVGRWEWLAFGEFLPGIASANAREMVIRNGWKIVPVEDAELRSRDLCPACAKQTKRKQRQPEPCAAP